VAVSQLYVLGGHIVGQSSITTAVEGAMNENKSNWADKANLASSVLQNIQFQEVHTTLRALGTLQAEKVRLELNERQTAEHEGQLREHIWRLAQDFERFLGNSAVTPCTRYILTKQIQVSMAQFGITTASFRQFADKDRLGGFILSMQQAMQKAGDQMSGDQKADMETYLRYMAEAQELDALVNKLQSEDQEKQKQLAITKARREKSLERLEELRQKVEKPEEKEAEPQNRQSGVWTTVAMVTTIVIAPPIGVAWLIYRSLHTKSKSKKTPQEQMTTLSAKIEKDQHTISDLELWIDTPWEPDVFAKFQAQDLSQLLQLKQEREAFVLQFCQTNGLPLNAPVQDNSQNQQRLITSQTSHCELSPEVQELARDVHSKITAIVLHQKQSGVSLAEAKAAVEAFFKKVHPENS
jgi:hypothetical protein